MQILLSRIEREYILHSFKNETPELNILISGNFYRIIKSDYQISNDYIFFKSDELENDNTPLDNSAKVFFMHKDIPFSFTTDVEQKKDIYFCKIPEQLYKNKNENNDKNFSFFLETSNGFKMKAETIKNFPIAYDENEVMKIKSEKKLIKLRKDFATLRKNNATELSKTLLNRIERIRTYEDKLKISTSMLFIDSEFILIYCSEKQAHIIATSISTRVEISLKERNITASVGYDFFYSFTNKNIEFFTDTAKQMRNSLAGIVCLNIKKIQEEDKRFLHEHTHSEKYGSLS